MNDWVLKAFELTPLCKLHKLEMRAWIPCLYLPPLDGASESSESENSIQCWLPQSIFRKRDKANRRFMLSNGLLNLSTASHDKKYLQTII